MTKATTDGPPTQYSPAESPLPTRPTPVVVAAAAIFIVVLARTWPMLGWLYPLWVQTSAQFHQQFTWAGLMAGTTACWYATRHRPRKPGRSKPHETCLEPLAVIDHLTVLGSWLVGAYLAALLPLVVSTMLAGGLGTADPLAMLSGVMAMVAAVAVGYALGTAFPSVVMVPIVAIGSYALVVGANAARTTHAVMPVLNLEPVFGQRESVPMLLFRITLFSVITAAAIGLARKSLDRRTTGTTQPWRKIVDIATYTAVPAALITISLMRPPAVFTTGDQPPMSCTKQHGIHYCVHADNQPRLADLVRAVDPIIIRYGTQPTNLERVWDQTLTLHPIDAGLAHGLELAWLNPDGTIQTQIADTIAGANSCALTAPENSGSTR